MITKYRPSASMHWNWVTLSGPDSRDFLHRLTTVNLHQLDVGKGAPGCFLSALGKFRAYFTLWAFAPGDFAFEFEGGADHHWKKSLLETIDQFTFGEKLSLADIQELACAWIFTDTDADRNRLPAELASMEPFETRAISEEIRICHHGKSDYGREWITAWARPARLEQWLDSLSAIEKDVELSTLERWRIEAVRPRVGVEITDSAMPLEIGLGDAISNNKGCFPGQEVVERIRSLGAPPRRLVRIDGRGTVPKAGEKILNLAEPPMEVGEVTSVAGEGDSFVALGLVRKIHAKEGLSVKLGSGAVGSINKVAP